MFLRADRTRDAKEEKKKDDKKAEKKGPAAASEEKKEEAKAEKPAKAKKVETLTHGVERRNAPTAELQSIAERVDELSPTPPLRLPRATKLPKGEERERGQCGVDRHALMVAVRLLLGVTRTGGVKRGRQYFLSNRFARYAM